MASTPSAHVLRVRRTDSEADYILLHITPNGPSPLDLKLLATEGELPYQTTIKTSTIFHLRDPKSPQDESEWKYLLTTILLQQPPNPWFPTKNTSLTATISSRILTLIFRNSIQGITQRLGELVLPCDEDQEIDTVAWTLTSLQHSESLQAQLNDLQGKYEQQGSQLSEMERQLEDFIESKKSDEEVMLARFRELLNEKKLKIREQQRVLAGAKVERRVGRGQGTPGTGGEKKRKRKVEVEVEEDEDEEAFEKRDVKEEGGQEEDDDGEAGTPDRTDEDETEDEDQDLRSQPFPERGQNTVSAGEEAREEVTEEVGEADSPPPKKLPLGNDGAASQELGRVEGTQQPSNLAQEAGNEDDETTDEDDEL